MKIFLYVRVRIKIIPWKFRILNPKNSLVICSWCLYFFLKSRLLFNIFKQTFRKLYGQITWEFLGLRIRNFQSIIFIWTQTYRKNISVPLPRLLYVRFANKKTPWSFCSHDLGSQVRIWLQLLVTKAEDKFKLTFVQISNECFSM